MTLEQPLAARAPRTPRRGGGGAPRRRVRLPALPDPRPRDAPTTSPARPSRRRCACGSASTRARGTARTWLLGIARTTALDWFRAESRRRRREEAAAAPERVEEAFVEGLSPELQAALATLSAGEREVLALRIVLELDGDATARVLGISPTAVSTRLSRALQRLEERVSER